MQRKVGETHRSNCLLAVLMLKLRHPRTVEIRRRSAVSNWRRYGVFCPHFYAVHGGVEYHFHTDKTLRFPWYFWVFRGYLRAVG